MTQFRDSAEVKVLGDFEKSFGRSAKEYSVDNSFVLERYKAEFVRQREDDVEITSLENLGRPGIEPFRS